MKSIVMVLGFVLVMITCRNVFAGEIASLSIEVDEAMVETVNANLNYVASLLEEKKGYTTLSELDQIEERFESLGVEISGLVIPLFRATAHAYAMLEDLQKAEELQKQVNALLQSAESHKKERDRYRAIVEVDEYY